MAFYLTLLRSQLFAKLPYPTSSFAGQTIVVTGSNTGLGLEAARHIVRLGAARVILAVRTISKGEAAAENIIATTRATKDVIEVWPLDLSDYDSVRAFGARLQTLDRLDAVVQNAGVLTSQWKVDQGSGLESHIAINSVAAVLVGLLALPKLKETARKTGARTRLSFVGSDLHFIAALKEAEREGALLDVLSDEKSANMGDRYNTSKLLLHYAIQELAARSPLDAGAGVIISDVTPGACESDLFRDEQGWLQSIVQSILTKLVARTTEVGSRALVHAVNPELGPEAHGRFLMDCRVVEDWDTVTSKRGQNLRKRWISELFPRLESISPGVTSVLES
ncbi:retinol dehydrogenase 12 [Karstenula rhodostoma CBS 690.94]|uniref:Retinol dehydrogenase 12 n=1 Tax=Karstenula rhodostoma CBS 690.94 TaxID=1392251 RepID=A0A9P4PW45_9PLEO|nr:retinol dehydrogenase 12 [Karstenula rhodostoma CBS 690.94]